MQTISELDWLLWIEVVYVITVVFVALRIIYDTESTSKTLAYLLLIIFIPILGILFYFSFGINYRRRKIYSKKLEDSDGYNARLLTRIAKSDSSDQVCLNSIVKDNLGFVRMLSHTDFGEGLLLECESAELLENGEVFFPKLLEDLRNAKHHIHLEYYIYEDDDIGKEISNILIEKAKQGVEVRFIYDDFGSSSIRKTLVKHMRANKVAVHPFNKIILIALANRLNYRNHRKIVVIDGEIGYTGGINISDRYDNRKRDGNDYFWRDTHLRVKGKGVYGLQYVFLADWNFCSKESISFSEVYFPNSSHKTPGKIPVQVVASGPDSDHPSILYSVLKAIQTAKSEILITTPYYIPDESLQLAIKMAALSGKKVKMILPGITDSNIVKWASESYFQELLELGVEIYLYKKGFIHAKTMVTDVGICSIGTCNLDHRSFDLNFEINMFLYDSEIANNMRSMFYRDTQDSLKLELERWNKRSKWHRLKNSFIRLFSPLL